MLDEAKIKVIADGVAKANLHSSAVGTSIVPTSDLDGQSALQITVVLTPGSSAALDADSLLNTKVQIHDRLQAAGEDRFPFVRFVGEDELKEEESAAS